MIVTKVVLYLWLYLLKNQLIDKNVILNPTITLIWLKVIVFTLHVEEIQLNREKVRFVQTQ
jgi:hypothetical protein